VDAADGGDLAGLRVFVEPGAGHVVGVAQAHLGPRGQPVPFFGSLFAKVVAFDEEFAGKGHWPGAHGRVLGVVGKVDGFDGVFGIVFDDELDGLKDAHHAAGPAVQVFAQAMFQKGHVHEVVGLGDADAVAEVAQGLGGVPPAAPAAPGGHARGGPARDVGRGDELGELALA
jgi:hypothetical protein